LFDRDEDTSTKKKDFHGAFVRQVSDGLINRYSPVKGWVLDMFGGSMTTFRSAYELGRNSVSTDIAFKVKKSRTMHLTHETQHYRYKVSAAHDKYLFAWKENREREFDLTILHPPYYDIIQFSENAMDLSTFNPLAFRTVMNFVFDNAFKWTKSGGHIALVFGDVYKKGELLPAYQIADLFTQRHGYEITLKSIITKNMTGNERGKGVNRNLWVYRSLVNGFSVFDTEHIFIWQKKP